MEISQINEEHIKIAELSRKIGQILVERGDYEQAMQQFQLGLHYLEGLEHHELARIYNEIGRVYWHQGKLKEAQEWTEKAFRLAEKLLDPEELARLLYFAGIRYFRQGENQLAEEHWLRSLEICQKIGDLPTQAKLYQNLGWQSKIKGHYTKSLEYLEKGRDIARQCEDISTLSFIYETLGETYYALGEWDKAVEALKESLELTERAGLRKATSRVLSSLGDIYLRQGKLAEADECYQQSLAAITSTGSSQSLFVVNLGLGLINMERQNYDQAQKYLENAWAITSEGAGFTSRMALVKAHLGELFLYKGELDKAEEACQVALDLAARAEARPQLAYATLLKGMIASRREKWDEAQKLYEEALHTFEELGDKYLQGRACFELGAMYRASDQEKSETWLARAREIFSALGAQADLKRLSELESRNKWDADEH